MKIKELIEKIDKGDIKSDISLQREIIYSEYKQSLVIDSIVNDIPLPAFYFWKNKDGKFEVLDGKQRIYAITRFWHNDLEYNGKIRKQTDPKIQSLIEETELKVIECSGNEEHKREIFNRINTLGVALSEFEVLNGLYDGEYLRSLSQFVKSDKSVIKIYKANNRGAIQMSILKLLCNTKKMDELGSYLKLVKDKSFNEDVKKVKPILNFVYDIFDAKLYSGHKEILLLLAKRYVKDRSIWFQNKTKINNWLLKWVKSDDYKLTKNKFDVFEHCILSIIDGLKVDPKRNFTADDKYELFLDLKNEDNQCQCAICKNWFDLEDMEVDHIKPWSKGGPTDLSNAQLLCQVCNRKKGNK